MDDSERTPGSYTEEEYASVSVECPHCRNIVEISRSGPLICPWSYCRQRYTVYLLSPTKVVAIAAEKFVDIESKTAACYVHENNKAVTVCKRCGSFICALCEVKIGETAFCPKCFDHKKEKKELSSRKTSAIAWGPVLTCSALVGLIPLFGLLTVLPGIPMGIYGLYSMQKDNMTYGRMSVIVGIVILSLLLIYHGVFLYALIF